MKSIPVDHLFQIISVDFVELPVTMNRNRYAVVFQDFFTKWLMVYGAPDQKAVKIAVWCIRSFII